jgi:hypothetical protein
MAMKFRLPRPCRLTELLFVFGHDDLELVAEEVPADWTKRSYVEVPIPDPIWLPSNEMSYRYSPKHDPGFALPRPRVWNGWKPPMHLQHFTEMDTIAL